MPVEDSSKDIEILISLKFLTILQVTSGSSSASRTLRATDEPGTYVLTRIPEDERVQKVVTCWLQATRLCTPSAVTTAVLQIGSETP